MKTIKLYYEERLFLAIYLAREYASLACIQTTDPKQENLINARKRLINGILEKLKGDED